jgi:rhodanese-related sulfurtransferase
MFGGPRVPSVSVDGLPSGAYLLDVREDDEWQAGHAPDAHHVPMMQIPTRMAEVPADRDVVVVCRVGSRSAQVVAYLQANGWARAVNLDGGMLDWAAQGRPMVSEDGSAPRVA